VQLDCNIVPVPCMCLPWVVVTLSIVMICLLTSVETLGYVNKQSASQDGQEFVSFSCLEDAGTTHQWHFAGSVSWPVIHVNDVYN